MAATYRTIASDGGTTGTSDRTAPISPAVGDLLVVLCSVSGNANTAPTCSDDNGGSYSLIGTAPFGSSANMMSVFVRTALVPNTTFTTLTVATGSNTAAHIAIVAVAGMVRVGAYAIRSIGWQANRPAAATPAPALNKAALTGNLTIGAVANSSAAPIISPPTNWTERLDFSQATPNTGIEVVTRNSGFTGTAVTWGGTSATDFAAVVLELDDRANPTVTSVTPGTGRTGGETSVVVAGTLFDDGATVAFGDESATGVLVASATQITCTTPPGSGVTDVSVTQANGLTITLDDGFTYSGPTGINRGGFEESILAISPVWLKGENGSKFQRMQGREFDSLVDWGHQAVRAAMPGAGATTTSLGLIAKDARIERGPNETPTHFISRLRGAVDSHRTQGNPGTLLRQLAAHFSPSVAYPIRLVNNAAVWHEYNYSTDVVTKTNVGTNWDWDGDATKWWRGWVIIDISASGYTTHTYGSGVFGPDLDVYGFVPAALALAVKRIVRAWKPANASPMIIFTNSATMLRRTDTSPNNPDGDWDVVSNRAANANYIQVEGT